MGKPYAVKNIKLYNASRPVGLRLMTRKQMHDYDAKATETEGFDVDDCPRFMPGRISPIQEDTRQWTIAQKVAAFAAVDFETEMKYPPLKSVTLIKANHQAVCGLMFYLTFHALDSRSVMATYRAKVCIRPGPDIITRYFAKVPGSEIQAGQKKTRSSSAKPIVSGFFAYVRSFRKKNPWMTFAQARSKGSLLWRTHLTDSEKNRYVRAAKRQLMKRTPSASKTGDDNVHG